jgi:hypothetical protein
LSNFGHDAFIIRDTPPIEARLTMAYLPVSIMPINSSITTATPSLKASLHAASASADLTIDDGVAVERLPRSRPIL